MSSASFCVREGAYAQAEPVFRRALAIYEKALGPEHPKVATSLENYAFMLQSTGRQEKAALLQSRAEVIRAKHA